MYRPLFDIFLVPSAEKAERLFASSFFDRTICESTGIGKFNGEKIFFFFLFFQSIECRIFVRMCIYAIEYDDLFVSFEENRMENLGKEIFLGL